MKVVIKRVVICLLGFIFSCQNVEEKKQSAELQKAIAALHNTVSEIDKLPKEEREKLVELSERLNKDTTSNGSNVGSNHQSKHDDGNYKQSHEQEQKKRTASKEYSLIGSWERFYTDYASTGEAFRCRKVLTYNSDGNRGGFVQCEGGRPITISGTWRYSNNRLNEKDGDGNNVGSIITWNSINSILINYVSVGNKTINEEFNYKRVGTNIVNNRQYTTTCGMCDGKKVVPYEVGYDTSCLTISEIQDAMSSSIYGGEGTVRVWVRCCTCLGKGVVSKAY